MTVLDRPVQSTDEQPTATTRPVWPARVFAVCLALVTLSFLQDPGRVAADTKLDLTVNPWGLLGRSTHLWDPVGFFGQLQNQAYGYLWPMGPFFGLGQLVGLPPWVIQRLWWATILVTAFLGMYALLRVLRVGTGWPQILAALAYALAVRPQSALGAISVEVLPMAVAPWVLVPLVRASRQGNVARAAALSALAAACAGGVNAVAAGAVLPLAVWWLIILEPGPRRRQLWLWWPVLTFLAILWWLVPLVVLGKYSPPFLDWIESATFTTSVTDPTSVLRGADHWLAYLGSATAWEAGWALATQPVLIMATGIVAAAGVAGLAMRSLPYRTFLTGGAIAGLVLVSLGHTGVLSGLGSEQIQNLLDGLGAPLRNVHKFDLVLRIPLVIAFCHVLTRVWPATVRPRWRMMLTGLLVGSLVLTWWPTITGQLARDRSYEEIPEYWQDAAAWLDTTAEPGRALIVPGASFGQYLWGRTQDEPLQPLSTYPWGVRDAVPLSSAGNIRMLDAVESRLESGYGSPGLAGFLDRMGVRYLVVRNDLYTADAPSPARVHAVLDNSAGINRVARFGDTVTRSDATGNRADEGLRSAYPSVEIYEVSADNSAFDPRVTIRDARSVVQVRGAPEALLSLSDVAAIGARPAILADDPEGAGLPAAIGVLTDTDRRREITFGYMRDNESPTMRKDQPYLQNRGVHDYRVTGAAGDTVEAPGLTFESSSAAADVSAVRRLPRGATPAAAMDGALDTWWAPGDDQEDRTFWSVNFGREVHLGDAVPIYLLSPGARDPQGVRVTITTEAGTVDGNLQDTGTRQELRVPPGGTSWLRIELVDNERVAGFGIREVRLPGEGTSVLDMPRGRAGDYVLLSARPGDASTCVTSAGALRCSESLSGFSQDRTGLFRLVDLEDGWKGSPRILVAPRDAAGAASTVQAVSGLSVRASSTRTATSGGSALAAFDRSPGTAWQASRDDASPWLRVRLDKAVSLRGVRVANDKGLNASAPLNVRITVGGRSFTGFTSSRGVFTFPPVTTDSVKVAVLTTNPVRTTTETGTMSLPVGISELGLIGADDSRRPLPLDARMTMPCGSGPSVELDGTVMTRTSVTGRVGQFVSGQTLMAKPCRTPIRLPAGEHSLAVRSSPGFQPLAAVFASRPLLRATPRTERANVLRWDAVDRQVSLPYGSTPRVLEVTENYNPGWQARIGQMPLKSVRVEGWKQAFVVPPDTGGDVVIHYAPDSAYRWGLLAGLMGVILVVLVAIRPPALRVRSAVSPRQMPRLVLAVLAGGVLLVLGPWGLLAFGAAALLLRKTPPPVPAFAGVVVAALVTAILGVKPGSAGAAVQGCALAAALAAVAVSWWGSGPSAATSGSTESPGAR